MTAAVAFVGDARRDDPREVVAGIHRLLDAVPSSGGAAGLGRADLGRLVREVDRARNRLDALKLSLVREADAAGVAAEVGLTGTGAWLRLTSRTDGAAAAGDVALATALGEGLETTRQALADGTVSVRHAGIIAETAAQLPEGLSTEEREQVEAVLVRDAGRLSPGQLRKTARRALAAANRSVSEVDAAEDTALRSEEDRAYAASRLTMHDNGDGTTTGRFTVPTLAASILRKLVQQLASPSREQPSTEAGRSAGHDTNEGASAAAGRGGVTRAGQDSAPGEWDWAHRYGCALVELLEALPTDRLHGKTAATVVVTVGLDQLLAGLGVAHLDTGDDLSAAQARRLACQAGILPAVLDGASQPLDLGRSQRFFTEAQRTALAARYSACAADGCDRPYAWCDLHHQTRWVHQGRTDLANAVPLCGWHHRRIHDPGYEHHVRTDPGGIKRVTYRRRP